MIDPRKYSPPPGAFKDRIVLVTGANRGIGRAVAEALVRAQATVILHGRHPKKLDATYHELKDLGPEPAIVVLDFERAQAAEYKDMVDALNSRYGRLDGLLLNAGILGDRSPIEHYDIGMWQKVMHINVTAQFILTRCLLPLLGNSQDASILFTTSGVGNRGRAYWGAYAVSKFATEGLAQVLADELENTSIRVNSINPGRTRTAMRKAAFPGEDPETLPPPQAHTPSYLYLLGPASHGVTGTRFDCQ
jgi:NAD(P)-dependent dehydrogenase (short-subunit alcohol dehydrogenase family)